LRTLATIAERISHRHPALTVAGATRMEHHRGTCGDCGTADFFCSALRAHIVRPIQHRPSQFSRPAFFYLSFFWAPLEANSCVRQLRGFCFPGSALTPLGSLPESSRSLWKQKPSLLGAPVKWGRKRRYFSCLTYMLSGIAFSAVRSPTVPSLEHGLSSLATPGTEACDAAGGAFRPQWREWPAPES